jgi:hypothetical protein
MDLKVQHTCCVLDLAPARLLLLHKHTQDIFHLEDINRFSVACSVHGKATTQVALQVVVTPKG